MASNTPNLGLLKKDPVTDGNDTFNIKTMLNDNWDKIDEAVKDVQDGLADIKIPDASLTQKGIVQLSNVTDGIRENVAATEKAVGLAFQYGIERKNEVVAALNSIGVSASTNDSWAQLITKMAAVIRATGNATTSDVLAGKTFSSGSKNGMTGTMPHRSGDTRAISSSASGGTLKLLPSAGYRDGSNDTVSIYDSEFHASNIKSGIKLFGINGALETRKFASGNISGSEYVEVVHSTGGGGYYRSCIPFDFSNIPFIPQTVEFIMADKSRGQFAAIWNYDNYFVDGPDRYGNSSDCETMTTASLAWKVPYRNGVVYIPYTGSPPFTWRAYG